MTAENIDWGGRRRKGDPTEAELAVATSLNALAAGLDYWLHPDEDGPLAPGLSGSHRWTGRSRHSRLGFGGRGIRGGWKGR
ncbi:hypothetical protein [Amycolatopsis cihanbeyliensis]|uniref:hypothetical protein n=1 Tax=Amycolatopsis cihanbeyliensis TaxID=1128664 RepID=UPI001152D4E3|nr:hypothetical protein [Amycolatopsis cihanbeyliensis]